jgi:hypothetical protein
MKISKCESCKEPFNSTPAPCPDGIKNCAVAHFNKTSFACTHCGHDNSAWVTKIMREGPYRSVPGMGLGNVKAIQKLSFWSEKREAELDKD